MFPGSLRDEGEDGAPARFTLGRDGAATRRSEHNHEPRRVRQRARHGPLLLAQHGDHHLSTVRAPSMLPKIEGLPGAEEQGAVCDGDGFARTSDRRTEVRGHVVRALRIVLVGPLVLGSKLLEPTLEITQHGGIGVLLDHDGCARVPEEDAAEARPDLALMDDAAHFRGDVVEAPAGRLDGERPHEDEHPASLRVWKSGTSASYYWVAIFGHPLAGFG